MLDASAVVPWFVPEIMTPVAERLLLTDRPLLAPRHLLNEVTNALLIQRRRGRLPPGRVEAAWRVLGAMGQGQARPVITFFDEDEAVFFGRALALAEQLSHSLYDCFYLLVAQREAAALATFDRRMTALALRLSIPLWAANDSA